MTPPIENGAKLSPKAIKQLQQIVGTFLFYSRAVDPTMLTQNFDLWHTSGCLMADVPCLDHLWDGQKDCLDVGQVRCFHEETSRKLPFLEGRYKGE